MTPKEITTNIEKVASILQNEYSKLETHVLKIIKPIQARLRDLVQLRQIPFSLRMRRRRIGLLDAAEYPAHNVLRLQSQILQRLGDHRLYVLRGRVDVPAQIELQNDRRRSLDAGRADRVESRDG